MVVTWYPANPYAIKIELLLVMDAKSLLKIEVINMKLCTSKFFTLDLLLIDFLILTLSAVGAEVLLLHLS